MPGQMLKPLSQHDFDRQECRKAWSKAVFPYVGKAAGVARCGKAARR